MKARQIEDAVWWVGAMDRDRRLFDGLIPLPEGTSYNAYFVRGTERSALIDTVDPAMSHVLFERLRDLKPPSVDYVIANHAEQDHSGTIPEVLAAYPMAKLVASVKGKTLLSDMLGIPAERIVPVRDGETIDLGGRVLQFIEHPWVHWPETMLTWLPEQKMLFPCDLFGAHLAGADVFVTDEAATLLAAKRYYAEIMMPFRATIAQRLGRIAALDPKVIAPSHGPIHRRPDLILDAYRDWVGTTPRNLVVVPYVSMHDSTRLMVEYFIEACAARGMNAEAFNLADDDLGKLAMALVDAGGIVLGSPMVLGGPHPKAAYGALLINALRPKARMVGIIGSFGWGGRLSETLQALLSNLKVEFARPVLAKGLPRPSDYEALDELADSFKAVLAPNVALSPSLAVAAVAPGLPDSVVRSALETGRTNLGPKYICSVCDHVYDPVQGDPAGGISPGTPFDQLPEDWECPRCRVGKEEFKPM
jgi:flavorubredoxin/rubredoxin